MIISNLRLLASNKNRESQDTKNNMDGCERDLSNVSDCEIEDDPSQLPYIKMMNLTSNPVKLMNRNMGDEYRETRNNSRHPNDDGKTPQKSEIPHSLNTPGSENSKSRKNVKYNTSVPFGLIGCQETNKIGSVEMIKKNDMIRNEKNGNDLTLKPAIGSSIDPNDVFCSLHHQKLGSYRKTGGLITVNQAKYVEADFKSEVGFSFTGSKIEDTPYFKASEPDPQELLSPLPKKQI